MLFGFFVLLFVEIDNEDGYKVKGKENPFERDVDLINYRFDGLHEMIEILIL